MAISFTFALLALLCDVSVGGLEIYNRYIEIRTRTSFNIPVSSKYGPTFKHPSLLADVVIQPTGRSIRLKCDAEGYPTPNISWYKNNRSKILRYSKSSYEKWSITLIELTISNDGNYTCEICSELGCIQHTYMLVMYEKSMMKPYIKKGYPGNVTVFVNDTVKLSCPPISDLKPYVYWIRPFNYSFIDEEVTPSDVSSMLILAGNIIKSENSNDKEEQLTMYNVTKEHEGWYVCVARITFGNSIGISFLTVLDPLPVTEAIDQEKNYWLMLSSVLGLMFFMTTIIMVALFKREKVKQQLAIEATKEKKLTYWMKKVSVEIPLLNGAPNITEFMPIVKIEKQKLSKIHDCQLDTMMMSDYELPLDTVMMSDYELPLDIAWEVPRKSLVLGKILGEGEFGKVVQAECIDILKSRLQPIVAVKLLKDSHTDAEMIALVSEMEIMKMIGKHINIINLLGCCTQDGPLYVIVEYAPHGNLREYLRNHRPRNRSDTPSNIYDEKKPLTQKDLVYFSYQVARGMEYLTSRGCIHRDLAARNVLVSDNCVLKIADFGLAKDIHCNGYYRKKTAGMLPVRWMAPESLSHRVFTTQTDVWSYGVLLWEIMTLGETPYSSIQGQYIYEHLRAGYRMKKPQRCSLETYTLMRECWSFSPDFRPSFSKLVEDLDKILAVTANQEYLELDQPDTPPSYYDSISN